ncbi:MAG TPA: putative zinc-binding metallopeptidase [Burkholderiaceae bacterium]|jgi:hypothetical protein
MKTLQCGRCGQRAFFENTSCESCGAKLGFVPGELAFAAFEVSEDGVWERVSANGAKVGAEGEACAPQRPCANYALEQVCNWTVPADSADALCLCCETTQIIPALSEPQNRLYWLLLEQAKRRLFYGLLRLGLPIQSKRVDAENGLSFQFLEEGPTSEKVLTGHDAGVITLNLDEADDARREQQRLHLHEPYRTLLGHFRHEIGHYYWSVLIDGSSRLDQFRALFGDERADYSAALQAHYATPAADWQESFVSSYASSHPWEDWAECWAHYLHIQDGLETAAAWGLKMSHATPDQALSKVRGLACAGGGLKPALIEQWLPISQFVNAMNRSLGTRDSYPFVLTDPVVEKLEFIHKVVGAAAREAGHAACLGTGEPAKEAPHGYGR